MTWKNHHFGWKLPSLQKRYPSYTQNWGGHQLRPLPPLLWVTPTYSTQCYSFNLPFLSRFFEPCSLCSETFASCDPPAEIPVITNEKNACRFFWSLDSEFAPMCWLPSALEVMMDDGLVDLSFQFFCWHFFLVDRNKQRPEVPNSCGLIRFNYYCNKKGNWRPSIQKLGGVCVIQLSILESSKPMSSKDMTSTRHLEIHLKTTHCFKKKVGKTWHDWMTFVRDIISKVMLSMFHFRSELSYQKISLFPHTNLTWFYFLDHLHTLNIMEYGVYIYISPF